MKDSPDPPYGEWDRPFGQDSKVALLLPLVGLLSNDLSPQIERLVAARGSDAGLAAAFASAIDPAIPIAARRTERLICELRALAPSPQTLSIYELSYVAGVLWNGVVDRRCTAMRPTLPRPALCSVARADFPHTLSMSNVRAFLEYDELLLAILSPLRWLLPTDSQQLWEEQPAEEECDLPPQYSRIRKEIEWCMVNLAGTVGPMADDLGMSRPVLMQLDHILQIPQYRWMPPRSRWRIDFFPVPIIASCERADEEDPSPTVQMDARGVTRREAKMVAHPSVRRSVSTAVGG